MYPIMLDLSNKKCVVVGGGRVAYRKITMLLTAGADVTVISPIISNQIKDLKVEIREKEVEKQDYHDAFLIIAATHSEAVNTQIAANTSPNQLINVVNKPEMGNFHVPASFSRGKLTISVSTAGASPHLAVKIKEELKQKYDESYEEYLDFLFECRSIIKQNSYSMEEKKYLLNQLTQDQFRLSSEERTRFLKLLGASKEFL